MKNRFLISVGLLLSLLSCRTALQVSNVATEKNISIANGLPEDSAFNHVIKPYKEMLDGKMNAILSHTSVDLNKSGDNSNLGNLLSDYTLEGADDWARKNGIPGGVDAAVINIGGIRSTIGKGNILTKHVYEIMPFENEIMIVKMKGSDLSGLFDYYVKTQVNNPVSKLYIETDNGMSVKELINGKEVDPNKYYYIATSDYLAVGGDNMTFFSKGELIETGIKMRDLFIDKFKAQSEITPPKDVRLNFKNKKTKTDE